MGRDGSYCGSRVTHPPLAKPRSRFGEQLRHELSQRDLSIRKLSRRMDAANPDRARRNLTRWITGGTQPLPGNRLLVAEALGVDPAVFSNGGEDEDDEESEMADLVHALMRRIDRRVQEEVEARLGARPEVASLPPREEGVRDGNRD